MFFDFEIYGGCFGMCHVQPVQDNDVMNKVYKTHGAIQ